MPDLLGLSARIIDQGRADEPVNRVTQELSEVAEGVAVIESFSHCVALRTEAGLVAFDASGPASGRAVVESLRRWSTDPVDTVVYTHGHLDHVGGSAAFVDDAAGAGQRRPTFIGHENVIARFARYRLTDGWNLAINRRQFGSGRNPDLGLGGAGPAGAGRVRFLPDDVAAPDISFPRELRLGVGGLEMELRHARGETDDHLWAWIPARRAVACGDFLIWNFPNAGNPQKVQRYPSEWAAALREMAGLEPDLLLPAHGLPIGGSERIRRVLEDVAGALEELVSQVVEMMNAGATLDTIVHSVSVPADTLARPYLRPLYDEPEFVIRNVWRLYGGWWDGNPARLKPPPDLQLSLEVADLAGGAPALARRAAGAADAGQLRLACQLAEWAGLAGADDPEVQAIRAAVYDARRRQESSLMARGIFSAAARESQDKAPGTSAPG